jgi:pimeloyl-ACP methyl ester carboxylesterase
VPLGQLLAGLELLRPLGARELASISVPTLAIWGEDDPYFPASDAAAALRAHLPNGRIEVLAGVGHNPVGERPDEFVRTVGAFLA